MCATVVLLTGEISVRRANFSLGTDFEQKATEKTEIAFDDLAPTIGHLLCFLRFLLLKLLVASTLRRMNPWLKTCVVGT